MKLNKIMMIAALVAGSVLATDVAVLAQDSTNTPAKPARPTRPPTGRSFESISTQLALTDDQKTKAKPVYEEMMKKLTDLRDDKSVQGPDRGAKMREIRNDTTTKMKDILTPEQLEKWQRLMQGQRRGGAGAPPPGANPPAGGEKAPE